MSPELNLQPVLVGVDGSLAGENALQWAAAEALHRAVPLHIVHVGDDSDNQASPPALARSTLRTDATSSFAEQLLADAIASVAETHPHVQVKAEVCGGHPARVLEELSESAALVVVGTRGGNALIGLLLGSVSQRVAGRAACPAVIVGENALPDDPTAPVLVGVSDSEAGRAALGLACEEASLRGVGVRAIRSMAETEYLIGPRMEFQLDVQRWQDAQRQLLDSCVEEARDAYPGLSISAELVGEPAHIALVDAAREASLLVAGRRREGATYLSALGPLASWLLHESPVPLVLTGAVD
jgi:nucleotide-binding universal stress UspA family protein